MAICDAVFLLQGWVNLLLITWYMWITIRYVSGGQGGGWARWLLAVPSNAAPVSGHLLVRPMQVPYHRSYLNIGEAFLYSWCWYASGLALIGIYYPQAGVAGRGKQVGWLRRAWGGLGRPQGQCWHFAV